MALEDALRVLLGIIGLLDSPRSSIYWPYLVTAGVLALAFHAVRSGRTTTLRRALAYVFARRVWTHRSVRHDLALLVLNTILYSFLFAGPLHALSTRIASAVWAALHGTLGPIASPLPGVTVLATIAAFVAADLAFFLAHLALHKIPALWAFHKVHHSAKVLVPFTVFRRHPVDILFDGTVAGIVLGLTYGVLSYLGGEVPSVYMIAGVNALLFVCLLIGFNLQHSHVPLSYGPLDAVLVCPAAHQIHHSDAARHVDRNFGNMLSIWDRLFGTYVPPSDRAGVRFGCEGDDAHRSVVAIYVRPFLEAFRLLRRNVDAGRGTTPS